MPKNASKNSPSKPQGDRLEGRNVVLEALKAGRPLRWIAMDERANARGKLDRIVRVAHERSIPLREVPRYELDRQSLTGSHNGVIAEAPYATAQPLAEVFHTEDGRVPCIVAFAEGQGAEDIGAVIRTALAAGATGIVVPPGPGAPLDAVTRRVSMGATEHVRFSRANADELRRAARDKGLRFLALGDEDEATMWHDANLAGPIVLYLGKTQADERVCLPKGSLAPTTVAAVLLYERERQTRA